MKKLPQIIDNKTGLGSFTAFTPPDAQLGTADWYRGGGRAIRHFRAGDFFLGRTEGGDVVGMADDRHVLICSGTRGGKGVSVIVPNLCTWPGSVVVIDPKGENAMVTARRRGQGSEYCEGMGQTIRVLDPFRETRLPEDQQASFNPLEALDPNNEESIDIAASLADGLVVSERSSDPFFDESARSMNKYVILHVKTWPGFEEHERNLLTVRRLIMAGNAEGAKLGALNDPDHAPTGYALLFDEMKRNPAFGGLVARGGEMLAHMEETSPKLFGSVVQVARTNTDFLDSPAMARVLCRSTFKIGELKTNPKGTSLFITLPQRYMETHARWLRLMTALVVTEMERIEHQPRCGHPVMMVLDEFPNLRRMRVLENAAAQIAGFGVKLVFVAQTLAQLKDIYQDNWETLIANAGLKLFFCNDDYFTREYVSKSIGDREIIRTMASLNETAGTSHSWSRSATHGTSQSASWSGKSSSGSFSVSRSESHSMTAGETHSQSGGLSQTLHKRALVTPDEVGRIFGNPDDMRAIALISGYQPLALRRVPYFKDDQFEGRFDWHKNHRRPPTIVATVAAREVRRRAQAEANLADLHARERAEAALRRQRQLDAEVAERNRRSDASAARREFFFAATIGSIAGLGLAKWLVG